ncbi:hypothetical protein XELAEV_18000614mg [Xenopus laevis]|nr:hypothetical protein XELAEV_18000614mg [Xenopus laevis]
MVLTFIWNNKQPRTKLSTLQRAKNEGGIGLPNFQLCHQACVLQCIIDWTYFEQSKDWITVEQTYAPQPLKLLPWLHPTHRHSLPVAHSLITYTLLTWDSIKYKVKLISKNSLLTPLLHNPDFPPGLRKGYLANWQEVQQIFHLCPTAVLPKWDQIRETMELPPSEYFKYQQLTSFITHFLKGTSEEQLYTNFENMCRRSQSPLRIISALYRTFLPQTSVPIQNLSHFIKWGKVLNTNFTEQDIEIITLKSFMKSWATRDCGFSIWRLYKGEINKRSYTCDMDTRTGNLFSILF